jgi:hypothetical protein
MIRLQTVLHFSKILTNIMSNAMQIKDSVKPELKLNLFLQNIFMTRGWMNEPAMYDLVLWLISEYRRLPFPFIASNLVVLLTNWLAGWKWITSPFHEMVNMFFILMMRNLTSRTSKFIWITISVMIFSWVSNMVEK